MKDKAFESLLEEGIREAQALSVIQRIWDRDASLWKSSPEAQKEIRSRLGWLDLPEKMEEGIEALTEFGEEIRGEGFKSVVLLGMGGSSLAPELFQNAFGNRRGYPKLWVLDSTDPDRIRDIEQQVSLKTTLFIVSSKSGGTIELVSLSQYFFEKLKALRGDKAGEQFVAITDPGTALENQAKSKSFRKIFLAPEDVGGRFSALSFFGLVPAALIGVDLGKILKSAQKMAKLCRLSKNPRENPALKLGVKMGMLAKNGHGKLSFSTSPGLESFGDWVEQLVAESTGKEGQGILPVLEGPINHKGHAALGFQIGKIEDVGGEFFKWQMATAIACVFLKINPFDQPDVQAAKDSTKAILKELKPNTMPVLEVSGESLGSFLKNMKDGDYVGILAFLPERPDLRKALEKIKKLIADKIKKPVTLGMGPRYLHSTGQLHKGGANNGRFLLITAAGARDLKIPGAVYTFAELEMAQAAGDYQALRNKGRKVIHVRLPNRSVNAIDRVFEHFSMRSPLATLLEE